MSKTMYEITFELRYAVRVLERSACYWRTVDTMTRMAGLLSGTAAFAAIIGTNKEMTLAFGICFAILQAIEYILSPAAKAAAAHETSKIYDAILAERLRKSPEELEQALLDARTKDMVIVSNSLKRLAYNDVAEEIGRSDYGFRLGAWNRIVGLLA
ncbi:MULTISPECIES: hypothetical protein [unclassified Methylococcus]|uniref:hypothetical protein n=1 Tax=unclassified Methylococcus TaxID=2618889 RepID=UPI003D7E6E23